MAGSTVVVSVLADTKRFTEGFNAAGRATALLTKGLAAGAVAAGAAVTAAAAFVTKAIEAAGASQVVGAQTTAVLKSTGQAAGRTADQIEKLTVSLANVSGKSDEAVRSTENMLLTFTQIKGDQFDQATAAALDMAQALGTDGTEAALQLGKALNNPVTGVTKLQRMGVTFSAQQKEQIANYVKMGDLASAQGVILAEVNREFGGSAAAFGNTFEGSVQKIRTGLTRLQIEIGKEFLPALAAAGAGVAGVFNAITENPKFASWLNGLSTKLSAGFKPLTDLLTQAASSGDPFGTIVNGLANISPVFAVLKGIFDGLKPQLPLIQDGFKKLGDALGTGLAKYGPQLADAFGQIVHAIVPLLPQVLALIPALLPLVPPLLQLATTIIPPLASLLATVLPPAISAVSAVLSVLGPVVAFIVDQFRGAMQAIGAFFDLLSGNASPKEFLKTVAAIPGPVGDIERVVQSLGANIGTALGSAIATVRRFVQEVVNTGSQIVGFFGSLPKRIASVFAGAGSWLVNAGKSILDGLLNGIRGAVSGVISFVGGIGKNIASAFAKVLGIHSPSRVFAGFGQNVIAGLEQGLTAANNINSIMSGLGNQVAGSFAVPLGTLAVAGASDGSTVTAAGHHTEVTVIQNYPTTRDPIKKLKADAESVVAGIWT